jgi:predicted HTH domain antitoxin
MPGSEGSTVEHFVPLANCPDSTLHDNAPGDRTDLEAVVMTRTLTIELLQEVLELLGSPEIAATKAREALIVELVREGQVSQGQAARLLGMTRWDLLTLMSRLGVPSGAETADELRRDVAEAWRALRRS